MTRVVGEQRTLAWFAKAFFFFFYKEEIHHQPGGLGSPFFVDIPSASLEVSLVDI